MPCLHFSGFCRFENLPISSCSYKNTTLKISHSWSQEFSSYSPLKFVFFVKSRLIFNVSLCFTMFVYKHFTNFRGIQLENSYALKWIYIEMNIYSNEYIFKWKFHIFDHKNIHSICIHFNMYSFECIERFSNFYLHICDKDLRQKLSFEKQKHSRKSRVLKILQYLQ